MKQIEFVKYEATGNDFVVVHERDVQGAYGPDLARAMCDRNYGIGSDGLIVIGHSSVADARMHFFNPDGTRDVCGNGMRAVALFLYEQKPFDRCSLEIEKGTVTIEAQGARSFRVESRLVEPARAHTAQLGEATYSGWFVNTGTPHFVLFVDDIDATDVHGMGAALEHHASFAEPVSVDFVTPKSDSDLDIRIWERSVGETLSCGTGASAAAFAHQEAHQAAAHQTVQCRGGALNISLSGHTFSIEGPSRRVFTGQFLFQA